MGYTCGRRITKEFAIEEAKKYKTRGEFQMLDSSLYTRARQNGWLDEICSHMIKVAYSIPQFMCKQIFDQLLGYEGIYNSRKIISPFEIDIYYEKDRLAVEYSGKGWHKMGDAEERDEKKIKRCKEDNINLIVISERNRKYEEDIKQQIIENLNFINNVINKQLTKENVSNTNVDCSKIYDYCNIMNEEKLNLAIQDCKNIADFKKRYANYYKILCDSDRLIELECLRQITNWTYEKAKEECLKINNYKDLITNYNKLYGYCYKNGYLKELTQHMYKKRREPYTKEEVDFIAKKYTRKSDFQHGCPAAYRFALKMKLLDEYYGTENIYINKYPYEKIKEESMKYKTRIEFKKGCLLLYRKACKLKIMDELFPKPTKE